MTTATRAASAKQVKTAKAKKKAPTIKQVECELGEDGKKILDKMAEHRQARLAAKREEDALKAQLQELLPKLKKNQRLTVRAAGVIRGTLAWRRRVNTDLDLLQQGWPEAYEACTSVNTYTQFDPA